jgi:hypothetical protein
VHPPNMELSKKSRWRALSNVRHVGAWEPAHKLSPGVRSWFENRNANAPVEILVLGFPGQSLMISKTLRSQATIEIDDTGAYLSL